MSCCVCYEPTNFLSCETCQEGKVCADCWTLQIQQSDKCHFSNREGIEQAYNCPCCRTLNWKGLYNESLWLLNDIGWRDYDHLKPAIQLFMVKAGWSGDELDLVLEKYKNDEFLSIGTA